MRKNYYYLEGTQARGRRFPLEALICAWLLLDKYHCLTWTYWVLATIAYVLLILFIADWIKYNQKPVDIQAFLKNIHDAEKQDKEITTKPK